jgi:hypothetical protein
MDAERVKPLTMLPDEEESVLASVWHAKQIPVDSRDTTEHDLIALSAELDATRYKLAALTESHAACVRALRIVQDEGYAVNEHGCEHFCNQIDAALSDPLSQAVEDK